jgi:hypothetical protein
VHDGASICAEFDRALQAVDLDCPKPFADRMKIDEVRLATVRRDGKARCSRRLHISEADVARRDQESWRLVVDLHAEERRRARCNPELRLLGGRQSWNRNQGNEAGERGDRAISAERHSGGAGLAAYRT